MARRELSRLARDALAQWWRLFEEVRDGADGHPPLTPEQAARAKEVLAKKLRTCLPGTFSADLFTSEGRRVLRAAIRGWAFSPRSEE